MTNKVLIIGDIMIDTYIYGKVSRVSPEAPVPVITPEKSIQCLGGAGNVARNAAALGSDVSIISLFGLDVDGDSVIEKLNDWSIRCDWIIRDAELNTINKTRIVGNAQQIVRVDYNDSYNLSAKVEKRLLDTIVLAVPQFDIIIISDYGKGTCSDKVCKTIMTYAKEKVVIVDPKGSDWEKYRGASIITPNMKEVNIYSGKNVQNNSLLIEKEYAELNKKLGIEYLLLTRSEEGMSLLGDEVKKHIRAYSHEVYDVSGAGDTVVASLASFIKPDMSNIWEATKIANVAAGLVVVKPGTAVVTKEEIQRQLAIDQFKKNKNDSKVFQLQEYDKVHDLVGLWRTAGNKIVTANGCFDILHRGHIKLLKEAKAKGDKLIVAINSDESIKRLKGNDRPINNENDRAYVISAIDSVDAVVVFDPEKMPVELSEKELSAMSEEARKKYKEAPMTLMKMISPDIHVKGGDYKKEDIPEAIYADELVIVKIEDGYSTTNIITRMK